MLYHALLDFLFPLINVLITQSRIHNVCYVLLIKSIKIKKLFKMQS